MTTTQEIKSLIAKFPFLAYGANYMFWRVEIITDEQFLEICKKELVERGVILSNFKVA